MSKTKKLVLDELRVKSFVTDFDPNKIRGGYNTEGDDPCILDEDPSPTTDTYETVMGYGCPTVCSDCGTIMP